MKSFIFAPLFLLYTLSMATPQPIGDLSIRDPEPEAVPEPVPVVVGDLGGISSPLEAHILEKRKKKTGSGSSGSSNNSANALDSPLPMIGAAVAGAAVLIWA